MLNLGDFYRGKKVLVTGADGFIGSHLTEKLIGYGALVSVYIHTPDFKNLSYLSDKIENKIIGDISDKKSIKLVYRNNSSFIFHLAEKKIYVNDSVETGYWPTAHDFRKS